MRGLGVRVGARAAVVAAGMMPAAPAQAAVASRGYAGTLADGATWVADVPATWNGTLILYSHGYGPLTAQDAPDPATKHDLLDAGYALVGSSYSGSSWWALKSAVDDQFGSLRAIQRTIGPARRTIAWGTSMGGLVSALEAQNSRGRIDGALTTCGLVAGALNLNDYQLDGEYAVAHLLSPTPIKLVDFRSDAEATQTVEALNQATAAAQTTAAGRARIALAAALANVPTWFSGPAAPGRYDYP